MNHNVRTLAVFAASSVAIILLTSISLPVRSDQRDEGKVTEAANQSAKAADVFNAIMKIPDKSIPRDLLRRAKAIAVFPQVIKASFVVGAEGGRGVVSRRTASGWSDPVFFRAGGGSVGPQIGASATDIVLVFMNDEAMSGLMKDRFELGADAEVAGGPVGREASAGTDALMKAQILSYSRSRGLFAGVSLKGIVVKPEDDLNEAVYNKKARELLARETSVTGSGATLTAFPQAIERYTPSSKTDHPSQQ